MSSSAKKPVILVSSTVYGIEDLLEGVYGLLNTFGYEVWMSHKGTLPVRCDYSAFENCLHAVDRCDLFLGIITPNYGSGKDGDGLSIVHQEIQRAIKLNKPRWLLAHDHVVFARRLLRDLGHGTREARTQLQLKKGAKSIDDLRVIDMYEESILSKKDLAERHGNWIQEFNTDEDALLFARAQFSRFQEIERFLQENLANPDQILEKIEQLHGGQV